VRDALRGSAFPEDFNLEAVRVFGKRRGDVGKRDRFTHWPNPPEVTQPTTLFS